MSRPLAGGTIAVVPIRGLTEAKTRLAGTLPPELRETLTWRMLRGVVRAALAAPVEAVVVVSPDPDALELVGSLDERVVPLVQADDTPGLDAAVDRGRAWALDHDVDRMLVLFGDLPLLSADDVRSIAALEAPVVLAPDRAGTGTNALMLRLTVPSTRSFTFSYGPQSFVRHRTEAERLGLNLAVTATPGTAVDLDTPDDWRRLVELGAWSPVIGERRSPAAPEPHIERDPVGDAVG